MLIEQGTELTFTLCNCSPPGLDLSLRHCLELPRSTPSVSLAQQESSSEHQCARGSAQGAGTAAGDRGSACQRWPQFLSVLSHREAQLQTLSFLQLQQDEVTTCARIFTQLPSPAAPCCVTEYSDSAHQSLRQLNSVC